MIQARKKFRRFAGALAAAALLGASPALFNYVVDPFDRNGVFNLGLDKFRVSERAHYPLWKMIHYPRGRADTVILGDSRARALRDKLWWEAGVPDAYNFAYGGGSVPEVFDTFEHVKTDPALKALVVGVQLRSFDPDHRAGINRVPEAIRLSRSPLQYYTNWFVARMSWRNLKYRYPQTMRALEGLSPTLISTAKAAEREPAVQQPVGALSLSDLLSPSACEGCDPIATPAPRPILGVTHRHGWSYGGPGWGRFWTTVSFDRELPTKIARQVEKHGRVEWRKFDFSNELWAKIETIARWCRDNDVELVFVIPPTITEMQAHIASNGHSAINHDFRARLAELGTVFDFDFDSPLTRDVETFTDAIHFNGLVARAIVGEIALHLAARRGESPGSSKALRRVLKRRGRVVCPIAPEDRRDGFSDGLVQLDEGLNCRIWRASQ